MTGLRLDHRTDALAEASIRHADHDSVPHVGMTLEGLLNLFREDLFAAGVDADRAPAKQRQRPVGVYLGPVANDDVKTLKDIGSREFLMLGMLAIAVLYMGIYPKPFTDVMNTSVADLLKHVALSKLN